MSQLSMFVAEICPSAVTLVSGLTHHPPAESEEAEREENGDGDHQPQDYPAQAEGGQYSAGLLLCILLAIFYLLPVIVDRLSVKRT